MTIKERMKILLRYSTNSDCSRLKVACSIYDYDDKFITIDVNRPINLAPECSGHKGSCGCIHAEMKVLQYIKDAKTLLITHNPCVLCAQLIVMNSSIREVYYAIPYRDNRGINILRRYGVKVNKVRLGKKAYETK